MQVTPPDKTFETNNVFLHLTLPEAQWTQDIDSVSRVISKVEMKTSWRDYSRYGVYTLGPLCLWQCFCFLLSTGYMEEASVVAPTGI